MKINTSADLDLKILSVDFVFIYIDIDIHIPKIDSRNMYYWIKQGNQQAEKFGPIRHARLALGQRVKFYWWLVSLFYPLLERI